MKKYIIIVTANDIKDGLHCHAQRCPLALAMSRKLKHPIIVSCDEWKFEGELLRRPLPAEALNFRRAFDYAGISSRYKLPKPFRFPLTVE